MKEILKQLLPFIKKYKKHVVLNTVFNLLYAAFSTLAFVSLIPMLNVLFDKTKTGLPFKLGLKTRSQET